MDNGQAALHNTLFDVKQLKLMRRTELRHTSDATNIRTDGTWRSTRTKQACNQPAT